MSGVSRFLEVFTLALCVILNIQQKGNAQTSTNGVDWSGDLEIGVLGAQEGTLPFWLHSNRWGTVDRSSANGYLRLSPRLRLGSIGPLTLKAGAELIGRASKKETVFFNEGYLQTDWAFLRLVAGRKKEQIGMTDSTLMAGSMIQSGNASPVAKIRLFTPSFVGIPGTEHFVSFKGYLSHGWMEQGRYIEDPFLHQKYLYFKVFPKDYPIELLGGIVQSTLWAGTHPQYGNLPDNMDDFWKVFTAQDSQAEDAEPSATGEAVGSSIGLYDFGIKYHIKEFRGLVHRQFYLETGAGAKFRNAWDGLWGVSVQWNKGFEWVNQFGWEYLYTKRQSSQEDKGDPPYGADSYYSNSVYRTGWTYHGRTIGNALLFSNGVRPGVSNNVVIAHQLSFGGNVEGIEYTLGGTYSRNYGARGVCSKSGCSTRVINFTGRRDQYSFLLRTSTGLTSNVKLNVELAYDTGEVYPDQLGGGIGLVYRFE